MSSDWWKKPEYQEETLKHIQEAGQRQESNCQPQRCKANMLTTKLDHTLVQWITLATLFDPQLGLLTKSPWIFFMLFSFFPPEKQVTGGH